MVYYVSDQGPHILPAMNSSISLPAMAGFALRSALEVRLSEPLTWVGTGPT